MAQNLSANFAFSSGMSVSIIQTRKAKGKDQAAVVVDRVEEEGNGKVADRASGDVESKIVQVVVQEEPQEGACAIPAQVEAKQDSHVQIIASGSVIVFADDLHLVSGHFSLDLFPLSVCYLHSIHSALHWFTYHYSSFELC